VVAASPAPRCRLLIPRFTEEYRQELLRIGDSSLYLFMTVILGLDAFEEDTGGSTLAPAHQDLCAFLEGRPPYTPWRFAEVCAFRGFGKSTFCKGFVLQKCLYNVDFAAKIMANSSDNARNIHFLPLQRLFTESPRADFLSAWLFRHRIPDNFAGWNSEQLVLVRKNPLAEAAITYWGIESKRVGSHPDLVWCDDLEGEEAEKSTVANKESWAAWNNVPPLLRDRRRSQALLSGTPHGEQPLVWRIRDDEPYDLDNTHRRVKIFWLPLIGESGDANEPSPWPIKFPPEEVKVMLKEPVADTQYLLKRHDRQQDFFDLDAVASNYYTRDPMEPSVLRYEKIEFDADLLDQLGQAQGLRRPASIHFQQLRFFIHVDPLHRTTMLRKTVMTSGSQRPAQFALVVCGVAPDGHVFVVETFASPMQKSPDLAQQADIVFKYYRKYAPHLVTFESVGAQIWFLSHVQKAEQTDSAWMRPETSGHVLPKMDIPRLSSQLIEAEKTNQAKEYLYRERLAPFLNKGVLHLRKDMTSLLGQLQHALDETHEVDLLDCLVQGAGRILSLDEHGKRRADYGRIVWSRPLGAEVRQSLRRNEEVRHQRRDRRTGYASPWR
jgi:hypothetical protein